MAKEYDNNNSGALFLNDRKAADTHPDFRGSAEIDGKEYWVSMWKKVSQSGQKFFSLSFQPKDSQAEDLPADDSAFDL